MKVRLLVVTFLITIISLPQNLLPFDEVDRSLAISPKELDEFKVEEVTPEQERRDKFSRLVRTPENFIFRIAPDRPLEKYPTYVGPISLDSYIYYKFKEMENKINARFDRLEWRIEELENQISEIKTLISRPQVLMPQEPVTQVVETPPQERESKLV